MSINIPVSDQLTYSTIRIECELQDGNFGTGTGFFFTFTLTDNKSVPAIVTSKHVIEGAKQGKFHFNLADEHGQPLKATHTSFIINNFQAAWIPHPDNNVDLCVMPIAPLLLQAEQQEKKIFFIALDKSLILNPDEASDLIAFEEIIMIGYPNGIWDSVNNMPIIRKGITATHPNLDYNGKMEFMIDAACFPGSSGSPVYLFKLGPYTNKAGGLVLGGPRIKLLGILYAGPQHTATGELEVVNVPTQQKVVAFSRIPNNLGLVIKSQRLLDFYEIFQQLTSKE